MMQQMSENLRKAIEGLDSIQLARENLLKACVEFETSILVECPDEQYDILFEDYEAITRAMQHLIDASVYATRRASLQVENDLAS